MIFLSAAVRSFLGAHRFGACVSLLFLQMLVLTFGAGVVRAQGVLGSAELEALEDSFDAKSPREQLQLADNVITRVRQSQDFESEVKWTILKSRAARQIDPAAALGVICAQDALRLADASFGETHYWSLCAACDLVQARIAKGDRPGAESIAQALYQRVMREDAVWLREPRGTRVYQLFASIGMALEAVNAHAAAAEVASIVLRDAKLEIELGKMYPRSFLEASMTVGYAHYKQLEFKRQLDVLLECQSVLRSLGKDLCESDEKFRNSLALALGVNGRPNEAIRILEALVAEQSVLADAVYGNDYWMIKQNLAGLMASVGRFKEARSLFDECLVGWRRLHGPGEYLDGGRLLNYMCVHLWLGNGYQAVLDTAAICRVKAGPDNIDIAMAGAQAMLEHGNPEHVESVIAVAKEGGPLNGCPPGVMRQVLSGWESVLLAVLDLERGNWLAARQQASKGLDLMFPDGLDDLSDGSDAEHAIGNAFAGLLFMAASLGEDSSSEASVEFAKGLQCVKRSNDEVLIRNVGLLRAIARSATKRGRFNDAGKVLDYIVGRMEIPFGDTHVSLARLYEERAEAYRGESRSKEAVLASERASAIRSKNPGQRGRWDPVPFSKQDSGVTISVLDAGQARLVEPQRGEVKLRYRVWEDAPLPKLKESHGFDGSEPQLTLTSLLMPGLSDAVSRMSPGASAILWIPAGLAGVKYKANLVVDVELISRVKSDSDEYLARSGQVVEGWDLEALDLMKTKVLLLTSHGSMAATLDPLNAPVAVKNFVKLAGEGFFDGTRFHRVIRNFMIQGGDPLTKDVAKKRDWGRGGPGYTIKGEVNSTRHVRGVLSMVTNGNPDTAGSQFMICHGEVPWANEHCTAFGMLESGLDTLDRIASVPCAGVENATPKEDVVLLRVIVLPVMKEAKPEAAPEDPSRNNASKSTPGVGLDKQKPADSAASSAPKQSQKEEDSWSGLQGTTVWEGTGLDAGRYSYGVVMSLQVEGGSVKGEWELRLKNGKVLRIALEGRIQDGKLTLNTTRQGVPWSEALGVLDAARKEIRFDIKGLANEVKGQHSTISVVLRSK